MDNTVSHIVVALIVWCSAVIGFISSLTSAKSPRVLALGNTFGGGVLLAAGLIHLANDSVEDFENAAEDSWSKRCHFPWAVFFVSLGFLTTLFIEETVLHVIEHTEAKHAESDLLKEPHEHAQVEDTAGEVELHNLKTAKRKSYFVTKAATLSNKMLESAIMEHDDHHDDHDHGAAGVIERGMAVAFVFLLAISCHSFIAGLGVGAMTGPGLWSGMVAVVAHKGLATFTLSTCFIKAKCERRTLTCYIFIFSLVSPFGILCGSLMTNASGSTEGVLVGLAGGSFLYIGVLEVISKEMENGTDKMYKLLLLLLGWGLMTSLAIWV